MPVKVNVEYILSQSDDEQVKCKEEVVFLVVQILSCGVVWVFKWNHWISKLADILMHSIGQQPNEVEPPLLIGKFYLFLLYLDVGPDAVIIIITIYLSLLSFGVVQHDQGHEANQHQDSPINTSFDSDRIKNGCP